METSTHSHPYQKPSVPSAPIFTDNSGTIRSASATTRVDMSYPLSLEATPQSEYGGRFAGHQKPVNSPITPSSQASQTGAKARRTPLPDSRPAPSTGSTSSSGDVLSRLDCLAIAASIRQSSPKRPARAGGTGVLREYVEQVMVQEDHPMKSSDIHKAVVALTSRDYKYQSVRKALCDKNAPFEPHHKSTWVLKNWGLAASRMPRKFGTGGGTAEARRQRQGH
ncbi:hypothetical protein V491_04871 [Pseudogymnoascus sp. VKM F-3775]|nr:hypothetical protein V491_04871 [Pseudogymnoascus sp. VKM F-3775]